MDNLSSEAESFIKKFHTLEGTLLNEKKKSLFLLLNSYKHLQNDENFLREITKKLEPKTYLEETYKYETLIYFKRSKDLFDLLKSGNDLFATKIIKQPWFIRWLLENLDPNDFFQNVFPQLSLVIRTKLLKAIRKESCEEYVDILFDELFTKYGFDQAFVLLFGCSAPKIKEFLTGKELDLTQAQLKLIHAKDRNFIIPYYETRKSRRGYVPLFQNLAIYFAAKDPKLHLQIVQTFGVFSYARLGYRTTRKYIVENREDVMRNAKKYTKMCLLNERGVVKELGKDFPEFFKRTIPENLSELDDNHALGMRILLRHYPKRERFRLYSDIFQEVYKTNVFDSKRFIPSQLFEIFEPSEDTEKWLEKFGDEIEYVQYKNSSISIPLLKERLEKCSDIGEDMRLFRHLLTICDVNNDYDSLLEILELICPKLKNTEPYTLDEFLNQFNRKIKLKYLKAQHWELIYELILVREEQNALRHNEALLIFEYCKFLYSSGKSFEDCLQIYLKSKINHIPLMESNDYNFKKQFLKLFLKYYINIDHKHLNSCRNASLVQIIDDWNRRYVEDKILISDYERFIELVSRNYSEKTSFSKRDIKVLTYLICRENIDIFTDFNFDNWGKIRDFNIIKWIFENRPEILVEKIDKIMDSFRKKSARSFLEYLRKYEHSDLLNRIRNYYLKKLVDVNEKEKIEIVALLATIMPKIEYLKLLDEYVPTSENMDKNKANDEEKTKHEIQIALAQSLRFTSYQNEAFPIILKYCKGDFIQPALNSLYCFQRISENSLRPTIDILITEEISAKKYLLCLASNVFPIKTYNELASKLSNENIEWFQKYLLKKNYKYFVKNPSDDLFTIIQKQTEFLTLKDDKLLNLLTIIHEIPEKYKDSFIKFAWNIFEKLNSEGFGDNSYFNKILRNISVNDVKFISTDFCKKVIESKMIDSSGVNLECVQFASMFMMLQDGDIRNNIQSVLKMVDGLKTKYDIDTVKRVVSLISQNVIAAIMQRDRLQIDLKPEFCFILADELRVFSEQDGY